MVKKRISGQTIAIIILAILLLSAIAFGGVFAFYSQKSNKVSGKIIMANLNISLHSGAKSEISLSSTNVYPNQSLQNTPLYITNNSSEGVSAYFIVVYSLDAVNADDITRNAVDKDNNVIKDAHTTPLIDIGVNYYNSIDSSKNVLQTNTNTWVDYVYKDVTDNTTFRCLVCTTCYISNDTNKEIMVIGENCLKLSKYVDNTYQSNDNNTVGLILTFQAYAIAGGINDFTDENNTVEGKCKNIVSAIYSDYVSKGGFFTT